MNVHFILCVCMIENTKLVASMQSKSPESAKNIYIKQRNIVRNEASTKHEHPDHNRSHIRFEFVFIFRVFIENSG